MLRRFALLGLACFAFACSSSSTANDAGADGSSPSRPTCVAIAGACHHTDTGSGPSHECHEGAHDTWTEQECVAKKAMCLAACAEMDGGSADADNDAPHDQHDH
jgi:hypothetical protein